MKAKTALRAHARWFTAGTAHGPRRSKATPSASSGSQRWMSRKGGRTSSGPAPSLSFYDMSVERYAQQPLETMCIRDIVSFSKSMSESKLIKSAQYVHRQLPVRLARRLVDLNILPYIVVTNPHIKEIYDTYHVAFTHLRKFPAIKTIEHEKEFTVLLEELVGTTVNVVDLLARGITEATSKVHLEAEVVENFLNSMLLTRISRRLLAEQHISLHRTMQGYEAPGGVQPNVSVSKVLQGTAKKVAYVTSNALGSHPWVEISGNTHVTLPYVPNHLDYILHENLKNAMRATVEKHQREGGPPKDMPPIEALIAEGEHEVTIRLSDQGGGMDRDTSDKCFSYGFTTVKAREDNDAVPVSPYSRSLAGYGFGLPLSRLYAQHFGGSLELQSMEGYGTNVYLRLDRTGAVEESIELEGHGNQVGQF